MLKNTNLIDNYNYYQIYQVIISYTGEVDMVGMVTTP